MTNWVNPWLACDLFSWGRLVIPHWRELRPRQAGVLLAVTAVAALNSLLGLIQQSLLLTPWVRTSRVSDPLFVIGHWRSGTTVLHHLLSLDPQFTYPNNYVCFAPHHFLLTEWLLRDGFNWLVPSHRPMDSLPLGAQDPQEDEFALLGLGAASPYSAIAFPAKGLCMTDHLTRDMANDQQVLRWKKKMAWLVHALTVRQRKRVVFKSPAHTLRVKTLLSMYPDSQFVCVTRSPMDTVASTIAMWKAMCEAYALGDTSDAQWEAAAYDDYMAFHGTMHALRDSLGPRQYVEIAYTQLLEDPLGTMRHLYSSLQLGEFDWTSPTARRYLQAVKAHVPQRHALSESAQQQLAWRLSAVRSSTRRPSMDPVTPP
jgi:hypothetical protein